MIDIETEIKTIVHFQQIVCNKIESGKLVISEKIFHLLMLINKELEALAYCMKVIGAKLSTYDNNIVYGQIKQSLARIRKYHMIIIGIVYG